MKIGVSDPTFGDTLGGSVGVGASSAASAAVESHAATLVTDSNAAGAHLADGIAVDDGENHYWPLLALCSAGAGGGGYFASSSVEGALAELGAAVKTLAGNAPRYWPMLALSSAASGAPMTNPMTTAGDLIVGGSGGVPTRLASDTAGKVLTSNGPGIAPSWQASSGGSSRSFSFFGG